MTCALVCIILPGSNPGALCPRLYLAGSVAFDILIGFSMTREQDGAAGSVVGFARENERNDQRSNGGTSRIPESVTAFESTPGSRVSATLSSSRTGIRGVGAGRFHEHQGCCDHQTGMRNGISTGLAVSERPAKKSNSVPTTAKFDSHSIVGQMCRAAANASPPCPGGVLDACESLRTVAA